MERRFDVPTIRFFEAEVARHNTIGEGELHQMHGAQFGGVWTNDRLWWILRPDSFGIHAGGQNTIS